MDEGVSIRAITIGVSVFIAVATISAVLAYYNTAKDAVRQIGSGNDIAGKYDKHIEETLLKGKISGTEVKNILIYFIGRDDIELRLIEPEYLNSDGEVDQGLYLWQYMGSNKESYYSRMIRGIFPNSKYEVKTEPSGAKTRIIITNIDITN